MPLSTMQLGVVCFSTTILVFIGELRFLMAPENRFYQFWQRRDAILLCAMIFGIASVATALAVWARARSRRISALLRGLLVVALVEALLAVLVRASPEPPFWLTWLVPVCVIALAIGVNRAHPGVLYRTGLFVALILSPLGILLLAQLLWAPSVDTREAIGASDMGRGEGPPIVMLIFDEWSYSRATHEDEFIAAMPRLGHVAAHGTFFTSAYSPAGNTFASIRAMFAESNRGTRVRDGFWWYGEPTGPDAPVPPRLFLRAQRAGYRSKLIGYYLPYRELVGESVPVVLTEPHNPKGRGPIARMGWTGLRVLTFQGDPLTRFVATRVNEVLFKRHWFDLNRRVEARLARALRRIAPGDFVVGHIPIPHAPFVFSAEGRFQPDSVDARMEFAPAKYAEHLAYLDLVVGRLLDSLKASGQYDSSLVVITSDHSWKVDTSAHAGQGGATLRHVPLLVRWPGQRRGHVVRDRFCLVGLDSMLARIMSPGSAVRSSADSRDELTVASCLQEPFATATP